MRSIHDIVLTINESLQLGAHVSLFGIATSVIDGNDEKLPAVLKRDGEADYVGIDDRDSIRLYHKVNSVSCSLKASEGYGRSAGAQVNTYAMVMIVFLNRKRRDLYADELFAIIQSQFPEKINLPPYASINIRFNSAILNDQQVYSQEYSSERFQLGPEHNLFQIQYSVEATFLKGCFNTDSQPTTS